jgi:hypothetical protein
VASKGLSTITRLASRLPKELRYAEGRAVKRTALTVTRGIRVEITRASGGDNRLSGVGRAGARVGAGYRVYADGSFAVIRARGPMQLLEHDTNPHEIKPRRRGKKRALKLADGSFAGSANHPGTRAKIPFERGYLKTRDEAGPILDREVQKAIRKVL